MKKAGAAAPAFLLAARSGSEVKLQSELQLSCSLRACDPTKVGVARKGPGVGRAAPRIERPACWSPEERPDWMVESVQCLKPEFQMLAFGKEEVLVQA